MTKGQLKQLGKTLWAVADQLRSAMNADDFRDYMLSFLSLRYLFDNYEMAAQKELGRDYPKTLGEFTARFLTEDSCRAYLVQMRWPEEIVCPSCGATKMWETRWGLFVCASCGHNQSVTARTIYEGTRKPLIKWFRMMWLITCQKTGVSALDLQQALGLGMYFTAWTWLHKLRRAMVRPGRDRLCGTIEVDETFIGGGKRGTRGAVP